MLHSSDDEVRFEHCKFEQNSFTQYGDNFYNIGKSLLTLKEMKSINEWLPTDDISDIDLPGLSDGDIKQYCSHYRYYPHFTEIDL